MFATLRYLELTFHQESKKPAEIKIFKVYQEWIQALYKQLPVDIRTVPTFVSVLMFCASRKACFNRHLRTRNDIDIINYANKNTTKIKAKLSCCDQIKFNEPVIKPG